MKELSSERMKVWKRIKKHLQSPQRKCSLFWSRTPEGVTELPGWAALEIAVEGQNGDKLQSLFARLEI